MTRAPWGFDHETWILGNGSPRLVVQRRADAVDPTAPTSRSIRAAVRLVGLEVPEPDLVASDEGHAIVTLPFVEGRPGSELLSGAAEAHAIGRLCGGAADALARIDPVGLELPTTWASGEQLLSAGGGWVRCCSGTLDPTARADLAGLLETAAGELDRVPARFAHGDLAPVNVLVRDGSVAALLDLDRARLAHPLYDAAWFAWVVTYHHPDIADAAWAGYAGASRLPVSRPAAFAWLQPLQLLERAATAPTPSRQATWSARLARLLDEQRHV